MNPVIRNILAVVGGLIIGSFVNLLLVNIGPYVVPLPEGADVSTMENLEKSMELFTPANFLFPFLGHALGTLAGAFAAANIAATRKLLCAMIIGIFFLMGGITMVNTIGGPLWFNIADLLMAYIPMALFGAAIAGRKASTPPETEAEKIGE